MSINKSIDRAEKKALPRQLDRAQYQCENSTPSAAQAKLQMEAAKACGALAAAVLDVM